MKFSLMFGLLCIVCFGIYVTTMMMSVSGGTMSLVLLPILALSGFGAGLFLLLAIVMLILRR